MNSLRNIIIVACCYYGLSMNAMDTVPKYVATVYLDNQAVQVESQCSFEKLAQAYKIPVQNLLRLFAERLLQPILTPQERENTLNNSATDY